MIEFFASPQCHYCELAKQLLERHGLSYQLRDIATDQGNREEFVRRLPRTRSLPQIFVDGRHIGGFEDLQILESRGELVQVCGGQQRA